MSIVDHQAGRQTETVFDTGHDLKIVKEATARGTPGVVCRPRSQERAPAAAFPGDRQIILTG